MGNVAAAVGTSAWVLASADDRDARAVADIVASAAEARLALERTQGRGIVEAAPDRQQAEATERQVLDAWTKWYGEALDTVVRSAGHAGERRACGGKSLPPGRDCTDATSRKPHRPA